MRLVVVGAGYVGLVTGTCFADAGNDVVCVEIDAERVAALRTGDVPLYEPGLAELVGRNLHAERLAFTTSLADALPGAEVVFVCVGTPSAADGHADLSAVTSVVDTVIAHAAHPLVLVLKSTVPIGTAARLQVRLADASVPIALVSNPEFLREGSAVDDFLQPDRVVIGTSDDAAARALSELYAPFVRGGSPILVMDNVSAELAKYGSNALLASRLSFVNELANLADAVGGDIDAVRVAMGADPRIGPAFLFPGIGYGGSCFPKDVRQLLWTAREHGVGMRVAAAAHEVNERQRALLVDKIARRLGGVAGRHLAVWGLAFKPSTDDVREAPAIVVIEELLARGARVTAYDPAARDTAERVLAGRVRFVGRRYDALPGADALVVCTEWTEFRLPDWDRVRAALSAPIVFDGRNLYDPAHLAEIGFEHIGIGRGNGDRVRATDG